MDGFLIVNKPKNWTSRDVVNVVSKKIGTKKVGHTGTLDPMAEGVLVLCIGKYSKLSELITSYDKEYIAEITLGTETDTLDITGSILKEESASHILAEDIKISLNNFIGLIKQEVPLYSAIKIGGKKLYQYARENKKIDLPIREINIYELELIGDIKYEQNKVIFSIFTRVSKGTYIRSLIRDIGQYLNISSCMSKLVRIKQGNFDIHSAVSMEDIKNNNYKLLKIKDILNIYSEVVDSEMLFKIKNGQKINNINNLDIVLYLDSTMKEIAIYKRDEINNTILKMWKNLS